MNLLRIEKLGLEIFGTPILKDVSLEIAAGEIHGVIGESGSGKSMTAFSVMQLLPDGAACSGEVVLDGVSMLDASEPQLCSLRGDAVGMVFQEPMTALNPVMTIGDQVAETILIHKKVSRSEALSRAAAALERCELPNDSFPLSRFPHELSGGQRQRVVIAMAIALRPKLLIADEPTTALDVTTQAEILDLIRKLVDEDGMGVMFITHDLAVVTGLADRITIMKDGAVVEQGAGATLHRDMTHPYTKALFAASSHQPKREVSKREVPLLQVADVVRTYALPRRSLFGPARTMRAVDGVSFAIKKGESLGRVGESGCGKSTLTRAILGLERLQAGEIALNGVPVLAGGMAKASVRRQMQVVFQDPYGSFNPRHKVGRLVGEPFFLYGRRATDAEIDEALTSVGLAAGDKHKYIHEFSGGQRQRIAIARALIIKPELIILDEAVSALDVSIRAQILDLLADLSSKFGLTYLFISHDLSVVRSITDRVLVMKNGKIVEEGPTQTVFENPQHPYTQTLIEAVPQLPEFNEKPTVTDR